MEKWLQLWDLMGAGKSTLASVLAGKEGYTVKEGSIKYLGKDLLKMSIDERAASGVP